jgi:hypothetical protein
MKEKYFGTGSPQALEAAIRKDEDEHFTVKEDLLFAVACSDLPQEEVVVRMARRICGTSGGWQLSKDEEHTNLQGSPCSEHSGFKHYIFVC